jgi:hypothetical protein
MIQSFLDVQNSMYESNRQPNELDGFRSNMTWRCLKFWAWMDPQDLSSFNIAMENPWSMEVSSCENHLFLSAIFNSYVTNSQRLSNNYPFFSRLSNHYPLINTRLSNHYLNNQRLSNNYPFFSRLSNHYPLINTRLSKDYPKIIQSLSK